jgi:hypothetical protein
VPTPPSPGTGTSVPAPSPSTAAPASTAPRATETQPPAPVETPPTANSPTAKLTAFAERQRLFLQDYSIDKCFLVRSAPGSADPGALEAFGASPASFSRLSHAYREALGVSPDLTSQSIDEAECAALDLLRLPPGGAAPRIELTSREVGPARPLAGLVTGLAGRNLKVLGIHYKGNAFAIPTVIAPGGDSATFSEKLRGTLDPEDVGRKIAVLAIISDRPIAALGERRLGKIAELAPKLIDEWSAAGASVDGQFATLSR